MAWSDAARAAALAARRARMGAPRKGGFSANKGRGTRSGLKKFGVVSRKTMGNPTIASWSGRELAARRVKGSVVAGHSSKQAYSRYASSSSRRGTRKKVRIG